MTMSLMHAAPLPRRRPARAAIAVLAGVAALAAGGPVAPASAQTAPIWAPPVPLDVNGTSGYNVQGTLADSGEATAVWQTLTDKGLRILASNHLPGRPWSAPAALSESDAYAPVLVGNRRGDAVAAWGQSEGMFTSYRPAGGTWSRPEKLSDASVNPSEFVIDDAGQVTALVYDPTSDGPGFQLARRTAGAWKGLEPAVDDTHRGIDATIALDAAGAPTVAWRQDGGIRSRTLTSAGTWRPEQTVVATAPDEERPIGGLQLAIDERGDSVLGWNDDGPGGWENRIVNIATRPAGGAWQVDPAFPAAQTGSNRLEDLVVSPRGEIAVATGTLVSTGPSLVSDAVATTKAPGQGWTVPRAFEPGRLFNSIALAFDRQEQLTAAWVSTNLVIDTGGTPRSARRSAAGDWSEPVGVGPIGSALYISTLDVDAAGNALATMEGGLLPNKVHAAVYDVGAPSIDQVAVPASVVTGVATSLSATVSDTWSTPQVTWSLGDGTAATGTTVSHAFPRAGTFDVQVSAVDGSGNTTTARRTVTVANAPTPAVSPIPTPASRPVYVPATLKGKVVTLGALVKRKPGASTCPKPSAVKVTAEAKAKKKGGKKTTFKIAKSALKVTKDADGACRISGTVTLAKSPSKGQTVLVRITAKSLRGGAAIEAVRP